MKDFEIPDENGWGVVHEMDDEKEFWLFHPYQVNLDYPVFTCKSLAYAKDWANNKIEEELLESL